MRQKHFNQYKAILLVCCILVSGLLTGCSTESVKEYVDRIPMVGRGNVFRMDHMRCSEEEARLYLYTYSTIYGETYGLDLWKMEFPDQPLEEYISNVALDELTRIYCMNLLAEANEIYLTEAEEELAAKAGQEYLATLSTEAGEYIAADEEQLADFYSHYALAQKVFNVLSEAVNREISDDEARVIRVQQIVITDSTHADEIAQKIQGGTDFSTLLSYNTEKEVDIHITRDTYPAAVTEQVYSLEDNQVTDLIHAEGKWYLIKVLDKYEEDRTEEYKKVILEERRKTLFYQSYDPFAAQVDFQIPEGNWEALTVPCFSASEADFFEIYGTIFSEEN